MKEESSELLMSYTASGVYQAVKGQNIEPPQHPTWNTGVYETEKITNYSQLYIESSLDQAKKKARAKKPMGRVVGRTARWSEQGNRGSNEDRHVAFPYLHELTGREVVFIRGFDLTLCRIRKQHYRFMEFTMVTEELIVQTLCQSIYISTLLNIH
jgi:hypothetical protein